MEASRILITEDDASTRAVMRITLQLEGHLVAEAANGREAMKILLAEDPPDVVLLDLSLPDTDGFAFLRELSAIHPRPRSLVIVVTADRTPSLAAELMELGAGGFVHKPVRRDDVNRIMEAAMAKLATRRRQAPAAADS
jgi:DNA-binding NtrC family response regulator